jgi:hypothetical protein
MFVGSVCAGDGSVAGGHAVPRDSVYPLQCPMTSVVGSGCSYCGSSGMLDEYD